MKRGEIWSAAAGSGYAGKPRPVGIIQGDLFDATASITVCASTTDDTDAPLFRIPVDADEETGIRQPSRLMVDRFDVSAAETEADFFAKCATGEIVPLATGTAKQRPIINVTDSAADFKVKTRGVVTDTSGQDWTMQSFIKVREVFGDEELQVLNEWVTLKAL